MFALNCRLKPLWKTKPLTASLQSEAEPHWTGSAPRALQAGHKPMSAPFGCLRWKMPSWVCLLRFVFPPNAAITEEWGQAWRAASGYLGLHTNYDKEASIRKTSVSLPVKLSCVAAWLEQPCLILMISLERKFAYCVYLTMKMTVNIREYPFQLEEYGIL